VLPFKWLPKSWVSMTGLIIGSIIPDFESFLTLDPDKRYSHSLLGMFLFDLPLGLLVCFIFHDIVRQAFLANLPHILKRKFYRYKLVNWDEYFRRRYITVVMSLLAGIGTHLLWDRFTHANEYLPGAITRVHLFGAYNTLLFILVQYISSVLGMAIVLFFIWKQPSQTDMPKSNNGEYWLFVIVATIAIALLRLWPANLQQMAYKDIITYAVISAGMIAVILASAFSKFFLDKP